MADDRIAAVLLRNVYDDFSSLSNGIDDALQQLRRVRAVIEEYQAQRTAEFENLAAVAGELDIPGLREQFRIIADTHGFLPAQIEDLMPIGLLDDLLAYIAKRQAMIRDEGFAPE